MTLGATPEEIGAREHFEKLYANWLSARAALYAEQADESDAAASERQDRIDEAARELLATPAPLSWAVWFKWEILEDWAAGHGCADKWIDNRVTFALGCIKADSIGVMD
jgi:hypothetical protein